MHKPMLGTQRRIEARIGQLLEEDNNRIGGRGKTLDHDQGFKIDYHTRNDFRVLAKGFKEYPLDWETWQQSRRALINYSKPLFDSTRSYMEQLRRYKQFQSGLKDDSEVKEVS